MIHILYIMLLEVILITRSSLFYFEGVALFILLHYTLNRLWTKNITKISHFLNNFFLYISIIKKFIFHKNTMRRLVWWVHMLKTKQYYRWRFLLISFTNCLPNVQKSLIINKSLLAYKHILTLWLHFLVDQLLSTLPL